MQMTAIDSDGAQHAFETLKPRIETQEDVRDSKVDVPRAAIFAASVGRRVRQPEVRERFASLPAGEFNLEDADILEDLAKATWYVWVKRQTAVAQASRAKLPPELAQEAKEARQRMLKVVSYYLEDEPRAQAEIDAIRQGRGYTDLASDLFRLSNLYERYQARVARDTKHYRAGDAGDARRVAERILEHLGRDEQDAAQEWTDTLNRAWTLLVTTYEEVSAAGRWLYRHDDEVEEMFPSLYSVGRNSSRPRAGDAGDEDSIPQSSPEA